jgi:hypothetical protein
VAAGQEMLSCSRQYTLMKRYSLFFLPILLLAANSARADEASKNRKLEEFFRISKTEEMITQNLAMSMNEAKSALLQQMAALKSSPDQNKVIEEFGNKVEKIMSNALAWESVKPFYIKLFSQAYTEAQVDDIIAFYRSPTGQAMVAKNPELMMKTGQIVQDRIMSAQPALQQAIKESVDRSRSITVPNRL